MTKKIDVKTKAQREVWLARATDKIRFKWAKLGIAVPADVKVTCGFPGGGSPRKRIGECWPRARSSAGVNEVMISPVLEDTLRVLDVLGHELIHALDDCQSGHAGAFNKNSARVGYSGGKNSKAISPDTLAMLTMIAAQLGNYPHASVILTTKKQKENTGLHKLECGCGNSVYATAKKVEDYGLPTCNACGEEMQPLSERKTKKIIETI